MTGGGSPPPRRDGPLAWAIALGPALAAALWVAWAHGPRRGWGPALLGAAAVGLGVLGLSALVLAWLPAALERAGLARLAGALRRHWDRDAR